MELDRLRKYLFDKVKINLLQGKITGIAKLPSDGEVQLEIDRILESSSNGIIGSITSFNRKDVSSSAIYSTNFLTIKDNIEYLLGEIFGSLNDIIDIVNDSILEKNQIIRNLKMIDQDFSDIESGELHSDGLKYVISDTFNDVDKIDQARTTAQINLNAGSVVLNTARAAYLSFPHYRRQASIPFTFTEGFSKILSQRQTPGCSFGNIFDGDDTDRWELTVTTSEPTTVEGFFTLKLSEVGSVVEINSINVKFFSTKDIGSNSDLITFHYLNQEATDRTWKILPGGKIEITGSEIECKFPNIKTTHIRVTWTKFYPDDSEKMQYLFGITEMNVQKASTVFESVLMTESLQVQPYHTEQPTIFLTELEASKKTQPGTNIQFYVAIDDPVPGKVLDENNNVVDIDADNAVAFVPNGIDSEGKPENYYAFASQLRSHPHLSGVFPFQYWQPKWQQISSKEESTDSIPRQVFFNVSDYDKPIHDLYYTNPVLWGDPAYTGPWPVSGYAGDWASDWSGGVATFPKSGYIWGEDPFSAAGVWWGDATEYPGWWRPATPTASGTQVIEAQISVPDFSIPVLDVSGYPVYQYDEYLRRSAPLQKKFWKIFKWPSSSLPIPGTVKISNKFLSTDSNEKRDNKSTWKWNYKSSRIADDYNLTLTLPANANFFTIKLEDYLLDKSDLRIIPDSIRNVKFLNYTPTDITDFAVEYGVDYIVDENGLYQKKQSASNLLDAHATITFADTIMSSRRGNSNVTVDISLTLSFEAKDNISASWDGYLFVPEAVNVLPQCQVDNSDAVIKKITIQQINDNGLILQTKIIETEESGEGIDGYSGFRLFKGLNLVRVFTDVLVTQNDNTDSTLALWQPDRDYYTYESEITSYMSGENMSDYPSPSDISDGSVLPNTIIATGVNFEASGITRGARFNVKAFVTTDNGLNFSTVDTQMIVTSISRDKGTLTLLPPTFDTKMYFINTWNINPFTHHTGFTYSDNIQPHGGVTYLTEVDINVLLYETQQEDDTRYATLDDVDGSKYVVVKEPDSNKFPTGKIVNTLHFNRTYWDYLEGRYVTYTTGTSGNVGNNPMSLVTIEEPTRTALVDMPPNTFNTKTYANVSTYGETINVTDPSSSGFLFWDTAENLETVFDIKYSVAANNRPADRIFMMAKLTSTDLNMSPVLNSYSLIINNKIGSN